MTDTDMKIFRALIRRYGAVTVRAALKEARRGGESNSLEYGGIKTKHYLRSILWFKAMRSQILQSES